MKHAFSTLGCPYWNLEQSVRYAAERGYDAIAVRFLDGQRYLPDFRDFAPENLEASRRVLEENGILLSSLNGSCCFHSADACERAYREGNASVLIAKALGTPYLRICGDFVNPEWGEAKSFDFIADGMKPLLEYAAQHDVLPLLETHGDFSRIDRILEVLTRLQGWPVGAVWHVSAEHPPLETYRSLKPWLHDLHIIDYKVAPGSDPEYCFTGEGDLPIRELLGILRDDGYDRFVTLEWEKYWLPHLAEPELAFPAHIKYIRSCL